MFQKTLLYILFLLPLLSTTTSSNSVTIQDKNSVNIVSMVNDYTLVNKVSEPLLNINTNTFSLNGFKEKEIQNNEIKNKNNKKNVLNMVNDWFSYFDLDLDTVLIMS